MADIPLEVRLRNLLKQGNSSVLVVDDRCSIEIPEKERDVIWYEHVENEEQCGSFSSQHGLDLRIWDASHDAVRQGGRRIQHFISSDNNIVLVSSNLTALYDLAGSLPRTSRTVKRLREMSSNLNIFYFMPSFDHESINAAMDQVMPIFLHPEAYEVVERINTEKFPTLMHYLNYLLTGKSYGQRAVISTGVLQHDFRNKVWKSDYLPLIDESLRAGSTQSSIQYGFIVFSDRVSACLGESNRLSDGNDLYADEKVRIRSLAHHLDESDLDDCAAIFIDNDWNHVVHDGCLGNGIQTLRRIRKILDDKGINIPIIYQSGHSLDSFSPKEQSEIAGQGAVLAAKDIFPKVCMGRSRVEREIEIASLLRGNNALAPYVSHVCGFPEQSSHGGDLFVVCSRIVDSADITDPAKSSFMSDLGVADDLYNHRMYVLARFHTDLRAESNNPKLAPVSRDFFDFDDIADGSDGLAAIAEIEEGRYSVLLKRVAVAYSQVVYSHRSELASRIDAKDNTLVITHNDTKWDNWFQGSILGDFGSVQPGMEYKDIAKSLLDPTNGDMVALDRDRTLRYIDNYILMRRAMDPLDKDAPEYSGFEPDVPEFRQKVFEMLFTESLRIVHTKAHLDSFRPYVAQFMQVVEEYS